MVKINIYSLRSDHQGCAIKRVFLKISQNAKENTHALKENLKEVFSFLLYRTLPLLMNICIYVICIYVCTYVIMNICIYVICIYVYIYIYIIYIYIFIKQQLTKVRNMLRGEVSFDSGNSFLQIFLRSSRVSKNCVGIEIHLTKYFV